MDDNRPDIFLEPEIDKQLKIYTDDKTISFTNSDLYFQEFQLDESICDEESIKFGYLKSTEVKFKVANNFDPLKGKWLNIKFVLDKDENNTYPVGRYKVEEDVPTADRKYRTVKCYDALYDVINADASVWYESLFPANETKVTLKTFRNSFFDYFGIRQADISLVNDAIVVEKTISPDEISGKTVLSAILELNGCLGHIGRDGKFYYIYLEQEIQGLYPRNDLYPADDLYPRGAKTSPIGKNVYKECEYEDFVTNPINKLQIRKEENDIGVIVGNGNNAYIIEDNFLVYGKNASDLEIIANNLYKKITGIRYRPFRASCLGNLLIDLGKPVRLVTKYEMVETYILSRTLTGIQQLSDSYSAKGTENQTQNINSTAKSIKQLKGKANMLERTVEETRSEIKDTENNLSSRITQNANSISAEVKRATSIEEDLSASIQVNADQIRTKVSKGNVSSEISQESDKVSIKSNRLIVESSQFSLDGNGNAKFGGLLTAAGGYFSGKVDATEGNFQNVTIYDSCTVAGQSITGTIGNNVGWNGSAIQNDYIGNLSAGKLTAGTVGRPYSYNGVSISSSGNSFGSGSGTNIISARAVSAQIPVQAGGSTVGSSNIPFSAMYSNVFVGSVSSGSSRDIKTNIKKYDTTKCLDIIKGTEVVSYNYKNDIKQSDEAIKKMEEEKSDYIQLAKQKKEDTFPSDYAERIKMFDSEIERLKNERQTFPETRYGFISEDAPWELVSMDRKTVDTYSAVAMCFGALQEMAKEIESLKEIIKNGGGRVEQGI